MKYIGNICFVIGAMVVVSYGAALVWLSQRDDQTVAAAIFSIGCMAFCVFCLSRIWRYTTWATKKGTLTLLRHGLQKGDRIAIASSSSGIILPAGITPEPYVVTQAKGGVLTFRKLRWYERLFDRLKARFTFPKRHYDHPNGVLILTQAYSRDVYCDEVVVVPDTRTGRIIRRIFDVIERYQDRVVQYDMDSLDIYEGEYMPWWSLSYWWFMPVRIANRFCPRVDGQDLREWPQEIR